MINGDTSVSWSALVPPELTEWVPTLSLLMPRISGQYFWYWWGWFLGFFAILHQICVWCTRWVWITADGAASLTGHMNSFAFWAQCIFTNLFLSLFFWNMKVISTRSAETRKGLECGIKHLSLKTLMLPRDMVFVCYFLAVPVLKYLLEHRQMKKARHASSALASWGLFFINFARLHYFLRTDTGMDFCYLLGRPRFLNPL